MNTETMASNDYDARQNRFLVARKGKDMIAHILAINTISKSRGVLGIALIVYDRAHNLLHREMLPFQDAVAQGNLLINLDSDALRNDLLFVENSIADQDAPLGEPDAEDNCRGIIKEYTKENVKIEIAPMAMGKGHWVRCLVDDVFLTGICKDRNTDKEPYTLLQAMTRAQSLLNALQGWTVKPW